MSERPPRTEQRIAVVSNEADLREVICEVLELKGYRPSAYARDVGTVEAVARSHPELVVLDLGLSGDGSPDGWTFLGQLRGHPTLGMVPVLVSSADVTALRDRAEQLTSDSMVASLEQPFMVDDLERAVTALLDGTPIPGWDDSRDVVLIADAEANLIDASEAALALLGLSAEEVRHRSVSEVVADGDPWTREEWRRYREEGRWEGDVTLKTADGRRIPAVADAQVVTIADRAWHVSRLSIDDPGQSSSP